MLGGWQDFRTQRVRKATATRHRGDTGASDARGSGDRGVEVENCKDVKEPSEIFTSGPILQVRLNLICFGRCGDEICGIWSFERLAGQERQDRFKAVSHPFAHKIPILFGHDFRPETVGHVVQN